MLPPRLPPTRRVRPDRGLLRRVTWALGRLRSGRTLHAPLLAREFEISLRTAYRDLDYLRDEMNVPMEFDRARRSFILSEPVSPMVPATLSRGEVLALFFAEKVSREYRGTPFEADLEAALRKIVALLPEEVSVSPALLDTALSVDTGPTYAANPSIFLAVLTALTKRHVLVATYRSLTSNKTTKRRLRVFHVFNHRGDWYVAAWDETRCEVRDFALHRVLRVDETSDTYEIPVDFDFARYAGDAFAIEKGGEAVEVVVRFAPRQARWIRERQWHATARVTDEVDGGCRLHLHVTGLGDVKRWVMHFGAEAEVLRPANLRLAVAAEFDTAANRYRLQAVGNSPRGKGGE